MTHFYAAFVSILIIALNNSDLVLKEYYDSLLPCTTKTNCVSVSWTATDINKTFNRLQELTAHIPRTRIIDQNESYLHAEVKSRLMHFIDDLEIIKIPLEGKLQIRSASRVGIVDFGVNRKRVDQIQNQLAKAGTTNLST